jgi:hypothetical protein
MLWAGRQQPPLGRIQSPQVVALRQQLSEMPLIKLDARLLAISPLQDRLGSSSACIAARTLSCRVAMSRSTCSSSVMAAPTLT